MSLVAEMRLSVHAAFFFVALSELTQTFYAAWMKMSLLERRLCL